MQKFSNQMEILQMREMNEIAAKIETLPVEHLAILLGLAGIALAAFAIHAVLTVIKRKGGP